MKKTETTKEPGGVWEKTRKNTISLRKRTPAERRAYHQGFDMGQEMVIEQVRKLLEHIESFKNNARTLHQALGGENRGSDGRSKDTSTTEETS
jgi:hypothetical protein